MLIRSMLAALLLLTGACARADAPLAKIEAMLAKPKIMCGRFEQSKQLNGMKKPLLSNGRFCTVANKGVLWRTLQPFPSTMRLTRDEIVHMQGERVAVRLDARQEPTVRMINSVLFSLLSGDLSGLDSLFELHATVNDTGWSATLKAKNANLAKVLGAVVLDGGAYVRHIAISEGGGDSTSIVFSAMQSGESAMSAEEAAQF